MVRATSSNPPPCIQRDASSDTQQQHFGADLNPSLCLCQRLMTLEVSVAKSVGLP